MGLKPRLLFQSALLLALGGVEAGVGEAGFYGFGQSGRGHRDAEFFSRAKIAAPRSEASKDAGIVKKMLSVVSGFYLDGQIDMILR